MKIKKEFKIFNEDYKDVFYVDFKVLNDVDEDEYVFFNEHGSFDINDLSDEKYFMSKNMDYIIEVDKDSEKTNFIPLGSVDFIDSEICEKNCLTLKIGEEKNLAKASNVIENIEKAIKMKYEIFKLKKSFYKDQNFEFVELD